MRHVLKPVVFCLLLFSTTQVLAWWNTPYAQTYRGWGYGPNTWPSYGSPNFYGYSPYGYGYASPDWNVRGTVSGSGDAHVVIEYHGNVYDDFFGGYRAWPGSRAYGWAPYYGRGRR